MTESVILALEAGLRLWGTKEARKYLDEVLELKEAWYADYDKGRGKRGLARMARIERRLRILTRELYAAAGSANSGAR